jgi:hypothetical protein
VRASCQFLPAPPSPHPQNPLTPSVIMITRRGLPAVAVARMPPPAPLSQAAMPASMFVMAVPVHEMLEPAALRHSHGAAPATPPHAGELSWGTQLGQPRLSTAVLTVNTLVVMLP